MKKNLFRTTLTLLILSGSTLLPADDYYFFIRFTDKNNSPYTLENPGLYLSERALLRRAIYKIRPDSTDLPVNPTYINQVQSAGVSVHSSSKWLNGITVYTSDSSLMSRIRQLSFVDYIQYTGLRSQTSPSLFRSKTNINFTDYGSALAQINQLKGTYLHQQGARGKGILIAVLDAGFKDVDTNPGFDSLRHTNRLIGCMSVVDRTTDVYREDQHGALVLSAMAGNLPGKYIGTAPEASYYLIQTEYVPTEYLVETDFWVRGAEVADSIGADVINSSLGYSEFDDTAMNFSYADMNGRVARSSIAAEIAAQKGIIVCNSMGNSGNLSWKYLSSPADAYSVISIGSVDIAGNSSYFSSYGPASDGRIKPEVSATGTRTALIGTGGSVVYSNGTSFSSPLMAGMTACYLQFVREQNQEMSIDQLISNITKTAHLSNNPHPQAGYGIPDFSKLPGVISGNLSPEEAKLLTISANPTLSEINVRFSPEISNARILVTDVAGRVISRAGNTTDSPEITIKIPGKGIYIVQVTVAQQHYVRKIYIQ